MHSAGPKVESKAEEEAGKPELPQQEPAVTPDAKITIPESKDIVPEPKVEEPTPATKETPSPFGDFFGGDHLALAHLDAQLARSMPAHGYRNWSRQRSARFWKMIISHTDCCFTHDTGMRMCSASGINLHSLS
jgi:hypothetical protein